MPETRTKIVATVGPACDPPGVLERLIEAGVDVLRINLSHGPPRAHLDRVRRARAVRSDIAILADLCGPKLRLGELAAPVILRDGDRVTLSTSGRGIPVADPDFPKRVKAGQPIYLADGTLRLETISVKGGDVECIVSAGGMLTSRKGINLPADESDVPALTAKDKADLSQLDIIAPDFVALSYVRHPDDLAGLPRPLIAKMEKQQAVDRMDAIIAAADGIMVARGDLGVEIPIEKVPATQKRLIRAANAAGKPVITATQMLVSMVTNPLPTRAEVTDVANAVLDGTDAVMLSEETAVGRDPAGVVAMMERILRETEPLYAGRLDAPAPAEFGLARAAAKLAVETGATAIVVGDLAQVDRVASFRPPVAIIVIGPHRRYRLTWGVEIRTSGVAGPIVVLDAGSVCRK